MPILCWGFWTNLWNKWEDGGANFPHCCGLMKIPLISSLALKTHLFFNVFLFNRGNEQPWPLSLGVHRTMDGWKFLSLRPMAHGVGKAQKNAWKNPPELRKVTPQTTNSPQLKIDIDGVEDVGRHCLVWRNLAGAKCCGFRECFTNWVNCHNRPHASGIWRSVKYDLIHSCQSDPSGCWVFIGDEQCWLSLYSRPAFKWTSLSFGFSVRIIHLKHEPII